MQKKSSNWLNNLTFEKILYDFRQLEKLPDHISQSRIAGYLTCISFLAKRPFAPRPDSRKLDRKFHLIVEDIGRRVGVEELQLKETFATLHCLHLSLRWTAEDLDVAPWGGVPAVHRLKCVVRLDLPLPLVFPFVVVFGVVLLPLRCRNLNEFRLMFILSYFECVPI